MPSILSVRNIKKYFPVERGFTRKVIGTVRAVDGISFDIEKGKTLGLVGESGCGKSTLSRLILNLLSPDSGEVIFEGTKVSGLTQSRKRPVRKDLQVIFQDPYNSLNPRMRIRQILSEPLSVHGMAGPGECAKMASDMLRRVGLKSEHLSRYPHQFSGGERQRIGIARALMTGPKLLICDEPVSSLDLSIQAQILSLMKDLKEELGLSYLFISHDLRVVESVSDEVLVMYLGKPFEIASTGELYSSPIHPYTEALFSAISSGKRVFSVKGEPPSPIKPPGGCKFHPRCPYAEPGCRTEEPLLKEAKPGHFVACPPRAKQLLGN